MASWGEALRTFLIGLERLEQATKRLDRLERDLDTLDNRLRAVELDVAALKETRATIRETVRAEITAAVAELQVRYERERRQEKPELPSGE